MSDRPPDVTLLDLKEAKQFEMNCEMDFDTDNNFSDSQMMNFRNREDREEAEPCALYNIQDSADTIISVQLLEFKTSVVEVVEELRIRRDAEIRFEEQINRLVVEKQELEWQKGKYQLNADLKEKEINGLKEELKSLQEQKLQLQTQAKDNHLIQLSEVEKRYAAITRQCGMIRQAHEKLEQNVEEATRLNKKLMVVNKNQQACIRNLKQDIEKLNRKLISSKVSSVCKLGEESNNRTEKEQQLQQLQHKHQMEVLNSLQHTQQLLQRQTAVVSRVEAELNALQEKYQVLERDNTLLREKTKEKEDRFLHLTEEHDKFKTNWRKEEETLHEKILVANNEFKLIKEAYDHLREQNSLLETCRVQQAEQIQQLESTLKTEHCKAGEDLNKENSRISFAITSELHTQEEKTCQGKADHTEKVEKKNNKTEDTTSTAFVKEISPDKCTDVSLKEPEKTVNDELPKTDYCVVINVQTADVYAFGSKDTEGAENTCFKVDIASPTRKPQGSPDTLAEVPVKGKMLSDSVDALGVSSADTGQQTDSSKHKSGMGESHIVYNMFDKTFTTTIECCKSDFISELSNPEDKPVSSIECNTVNEELKNSKQEQTECSPESMSQTTARSDKDKQKCSLKELNCCHIVDEGTEMVCHLIQTNQQNPEGMCSVSAVLPASSIPSTADSEEQRGFTNSGNNMCNADKGDGASSRTFPHNRFLKEKNNYTDTQSKCRLTVPHNISQNSNLTANTETINLSEENTPYLNQYIIKEDAPETKHNSPDNTALVLSNTVPKTSAPNTSYQNNLIVKEDTTVIEHVSSSNTSVALSNKQDIEMIHTSENCDTSIAKAVMHHSREDNEVEYSKHIEENNPFASVNKGDKVEALKHGSSSNKDKCNNGSPNECREEKTIKPAFTVSASHVSINKNVRSAFDLGPLRKKDVHRPVSWKYTDFPYAPKANQERIDTNRSSTPLIPHFLKRKQDSSDSQDLPSSSTLSKPLLDDNVRKHYRTDSPAIKIVPDMLNTSSASVHLCHKRDPTEEWNAIAQTFCEFSSTEHESSHLAKLPIPYTAVPSQAVSSSKTGSVANHLHDPVLIAHNKHETSISASGFENNSPDADEWDYQQISINDQVSEIEKFLCLERLRRTRKRKVDGSINELEKNATSEL
ncbi:coiled-coil domain-containing protein 73-like [Polyodon spathula]|uniref:coiled-coil domain-containing protein 73-like n=1 Tax=Polyodon spathula TaxID=7913 RepID=UPI001B7E5C12|nr:coiled-coil domain-containing protein 73-like [Polyodon spathula]